MDPQNTNARYLDKFNSQKTTSVRIHHPPGKLNIKLGGTSTFSLGWDEPKETVKKTNKQTENNKYDDKPKSFKVCIYNFIN